MGAGMLISPAWAHGTGGVATGLGPLILLGIAIVVVAFFIGRKKWRARQEAQELRILLREDGLLEDGGRGVDASL